MTMTPDPIHPQFELLRPRRRHLPGRRLVLGIGLGVLVLILVVGVWRQTSSPGQPSPVAVEAMRQLTARGQVRPIAQARVGTLTGGVLERLAIQSGDVVSEQQELARLRNGGGSEIVVAPFAGTITTVPVHIGDTVLPGAAIAILSDLSRFQIQTTDADEFIVGSVQPGDIVSLIIESLELELTGQVRTVALEPVTDPRGDEHYPIVIDLFERPGALRVGLTARVFFGS